jgi:hypothetical protein
MLTLKSIECLAIATSYGLPRADLWCIEDCGSTVGDLKAERDRAASNRHSAASTPMNLDAARFSIALEQTI